MLRPVFIVDAAARRVLDVPVENSRYVNKKTPDPVEHGIRCFAGKDFRKGRCFGRTSNTVKPG